MTIRKFWFILLILFSFACKNVVESINTDESHIEKYSKLIQENPQVDSLYFIRANLWIEQGKYNEAIRDLQDAISIDSNKVVYQHSLADAYMDSGDSYEGLQIMMQTANNFKDRIPTLLKLAEFQHILKQYDASIKTCLQIVEKDPLNAESYFMTGLNYRDLLDTVNAIISFKKATTYDDQLIDAWILLGKLTKQNDPAYSEKCIQNAIQLDSQNVATLHAVAEFYQTEEPQKAISVYQKMIETDPSYLPSYQNIGILYFSLDSFQLALDHFDIGCKKDPKNAMFRFYRGSTYEVLGQLPLAKEDYQSATNLDPANLEYKNALQSISSTIK